MKKHVKKAHAKKTHVKKAAKRKKGKKYTCDTCGIIVTTDNECACDPCDLMCCDESMRVMTCA